MVTFAIGDVQGCAVTLRRLLDRLRREAGFDPARDSLWLTGDLVNRGPRSLEVLRWAAQSAAGRGPEPLGERLHVVLGNHDLHLIGVVAGVERGKEKDTLFAFCGDKIWRRKVQHHAMGAFTPWTKVIGTKL